MSSKENNHPMQFRGKLSRWNDQKGFGFITPTQGGDDIFVHISALKKSRKRPSIGDTITFEVHSGNDGKKRAVNAVIAGVTNRQYKVQKPPNHEGFLILYCTQWHDLNITTTGKLNNFLLIKRMNNNNRLIPIRAS